LGRQINGKKKTLTKKGDQQEMSTIKFRDGMSFDTSGPLRVTRRWDGYYVVGDGMLCPVEDAAAARVLLRELRTERTITKIEETDE